MFLFKWLLVVALISASTLASPSKGGLEEQRQESQQREEQLPEQQQLVAKTEEAERKTPLRTESKSVAPLESKGNLAAARPLEVVKIEQERPLQQIDEEQALAGKAAPQAPLQQEQVEQVVKEESRKAPLPPPIQQQREEAVQLEEPHREQAPIRQETEGQLKDDRSEVKSFESKPLEFLDRRAPSVVVRASLPLASDATRGDRYGSWTAKGGPIAESRPTEELKSEHREEPKLEQIEQSPAIKAPRRELRVQLPAVRTLVRPRQEPEAPRLYTLGRFFGRHYDQQPSTPYYPSYSSYQPYYYPAQSYYYPSQSYYSAPLYPSASRVRTSSTVYQYQQRPFYVREYYLPYQAPTQTYQGPSYTSSGYRLHYSQQVEPATKTRRASPAVDEHVAVSEEQI